MKPHLAEQIVKDPVFLAGLNLNSRIYAQMRVSEILAKQPTLTGHEVLTELAMDRMDAERMLVVTQARAAATPP